MKKTVLLNLVFGTIVAAFALVSCSKDDNTADVAVIERPNINRTVDYTVLVVAGENTSTSSEYLKSASTAAAAEGATVSVSVGGKVRTVTTDVSGQATFTGLTAGIAAVTVALDEHTTCNYIVELYHLDSAAYDNEGKRIASTKVVLFSTNPANMITVSGVVNVQSNITVTFDNWSTYNSSYTESPEYEAAPAGTVVTATISQSELYYYVTMVEGGAVQNVTYEGAGFTATTDGSGAYSVSVPATADGLGIDIYANDLATQLTYSVFSYDNNGLINVDGDNNNELTAKSVRYVFSEVSSSVTATSGKNEVVDLTYGDPTVSDPFYYGSY
jgi:uncharacterized protein YcfL